jgi:drug/metabolite transporter (DMT)-like permease
MFLASFLGGIGAAAGWGVADFANKKIVDKDGPYGMQIPIQVMGTIVAVLLLLFFGGGLYFTSATMLPLLLTLIITNINWIIFLRAFRFLPASLVVSFSALYGIIPFLYNVIVEHRVYGLWQWTGSVMALAGAMLLSLDLRELKAGNRRWLIQGLESLLPIPLLFGISIIANDKVIHEVGWVSANLYFNALGLVAVMAILTLIGKRRQMFRFPGQKKMMYVSSLSNCLGFVAFYSGMQYGEAGIISVISTFSPLVTVILATWLLHERLHQNQYVGIAIGLLGLVFLGL